MRAVFPKVSVSDSLFKKPGWLGHATEVGLTFAVKTYVALLLALYISFWLGLDDPRPTIRYHYSHSCAFRNFHPTWIRMKGENHRIVDSDVFDPACACNIHGRPVQVPQPAWSRESISPPSVEPRTAAGAVSIEVALHGSDIVLLDGPSLAEFA